MNPFLQPFRFPKKLWLVISTAVFLYMFFAVRIGFPGKFPPDFTVWKALVGGSEYLVFGLFMSFFWLLCGLALGAFVAAILGILRQLLMKSK